MKEEEESVGTGVVMKEKEELGGECGHGRIGMETVAAERRECVRV